MFGDDFTSVPIVEVSQDESLSPDRNWEIGKAVDVLRYVHLLSINFPLDLLFVCGRLMTTLPWHRSEGYLVISGGLTVHTFRDWSAWNEDTAAPPYVAFHKALVQAIQTPEVCCLFSSISIPHCLTPNTSRQPKPRREALTALTRHPGFRLAHPREEHFTPIYIAAGAGEVGATRVLDATYGQVTVAFGIEA